VALENVQTVYCSQPCVVANDYIIKLLLWSESATFKGAQQEF